MTVHAAALGSSPTRRAVRLRRAAARGGLYALVVLLATLFSIPSYWTLVGSIKRISEILVVPPIWWPPVPQWRNYARVFELTPYGLFFTNTLTVSVASSLGQVLTASLVGYGFARYRFPGRAAVPELM